MGGVKFLFLPAIAVAAALAAGCGGDEGSASAGEGAGEQPVRVDAGAVLSRDPFMGVSCPPVANSFACDRVGLAVWLRDPAKRVDAAIAGQELQLDDPEWSDPPEDGDRRMFAGFLQPAGMIDGPLEVTPDDGPGRWLGEKPVSAMVDLWIKDGETTTTTTVEVELMPGWG